MKSLTKIVTTAVLMSPLATGVAQATETYNVSYIEVEECEYDEVAVSFDNGWVFICEEYKYPYHYASAVLIVEHQGFGGARLCLSGGECLKGRIE